MKFLAFIKNEATGECPWFVYVTSGSGSIYACRFAHRRHAEQAAAMMNRHWEEEGRLYSHPNPDA
jgi:hypothetical protein